MVVDVVVVVAGLEGGVCRLSTPLNSLLTKQQVQNHSQIYCTETTNMYHACSSVTRHYIYKQ